MLKSVVRISNFILALTMIVFFCLEAPLHASESSKGEGEIKVVKKININTASVEELSEGLKGVGVKYAEAIVKYREEFGNFNAPEEIKKVKGIGDKTFEANKDRIVVKD
ncbi:MAG: helix-hairpin-helix domain-containing protein [Desulfamplus sp.]|nr:helix-hairpin-helix domain-containing protein [Desulfamplus sp.]